MHGCRLVPTMRPVSVRPCAPRIRAQQIRVCVRELHVSDKHTPRRMHRRCPLWSGPPPPGNNSKSRVINPSAVSSFPIPPLRPSLCPLTRWVYTPVRVDACAWPPPLHLFIPLCSFPTSFCTYAHARRWACNFYPLASLRDGIYVYDVYCCKLLPYYGRVPTGLIEDPLELP